jgi:hypothetical protein
MKLCCFRGSRLYVVLLLCLVVGALIPEVRGGRVRVHVAKRVEEREVSPETEGIKIESDSKDYTSLKDAMIANVPTTAPTLLPPSGFTATTPAPAPLEGLYCRGVSCQYRIPPPPPLLPTIPPIPEYYNLMRNREFCRGKTCIG